MRRHRMEIIDRGAQHIHRWVTTCSCGWRGVNRRHKRDAVKVYRGHLPSRRRSVPWRPQQPTPDHLLPEVLRSVS